MCGGHRGKDLRDTVLGVHTWDGPRGTHAGEPQDLGMFYMAPCEKVSRRETGKISTQGEKVSFTRVPPVPHN